MMKKIISATLFAVTLTLNFVQAQHAFFPDQGVIEFDKTVHVKNLIKRHIASLKDDGFSKKYFEEMAVKAPETAVLSKKVTFNRNEVSVEPVEKEQTQIISNLLRMGLLDYGSKIYQNLDKNETLMTMEIGGSVVAIKDSLTNVKWKITNEYRNIAGYDCRRANGVTLDSVYVIAFYTDQIPTSASPSSLHGLPGMILGLVVPEQHFNIYATKVDMTAATVKSDFIKKKDDPLSRTATKERMKQIIGQWMSDKQFSLIMAAMFL